MLPHFHIRLAAFRRLKQALRISTHIHHHPYTLWAAYVPKSLSNIHGGVFGSSPRRGQTRTNIPPFIIVFSYLVCSPSGSQKLSSPVPGITFWNNAIPSTPLPAPAHRRLLLSSLRSVSQSRLNPIYHLILPYCQSVESFLVWKCQKRTHKVHLKTPLCMFVV